MSTATSLKTRAGSVSEIEIFRHSARTIQKVVRLNVDGLTQAESLIQPRPAGNCLNWVVGHLVCVYQHVLPMLEQRPVIKSGALQRYDRGSPPVENADEAMELSELMAAWDQSADRIDAGLAGLASETLDAPAPFSPSGDQSETVRSLLTTIFFHQAYHAGQTGILRRIAGKDGAIR
jgi:uncharacterized damage-inducible protein DinB